MSTISPLPNVDLEERPQTSASHVDLPCIIAGVLLSSAVALLFTTFGSAIGLTMLSPFRGEGTSGTTFVVAIAIWTLWVTVSSAMAGGYLAGRLRRRTAGVTDHEVEIRDGFHGLAVWAGATVLGAFIAASAISGTAKVVGNVAGKGAEAVGANGKFELVNLLAKPDSHSRVVTTTDRLIRSPQSAGAEEALRVLANSAVEGELRADDRQYLVDVVAARTGRQQGEVAPLIEQAYGEARQIVEDARIAAESARKVAVLIAFLTAASLLTAGVGAWWASVRGGLHRDQRTDFSRLTRWNDLL